MTGEKSDAWIRKSGATARARQLRKSETEPEYRLWSELRNRLLNGHKFSRQIPLGPYVVDFICREKNLIVELDGTQHAESGHDVIRTRWLNGNGYSVLRFWNHEVLQERRAVLETILAVLTGHIASRDDAIRFSPAEIKTLANEEGTP
jgi:very-short-patch-repair endonuclease